MSPAKLLLLLYSLYWYLYLHCTVQYSTSIDVRCLRDRRKRVLVLVLVQGTGEPHTHTPWSGCQCGDGARWPMEIRNDFRLFPSLCQAFEDNSLQQEILDVLQMFLLLHVTYRQFAFNHLSYNNVL